MKKIRHVRDGKSFFKHLKGYLMEEGSELSYVEPAAESEPICVEF